MRTLHLHAIATVAILCATGCSDHGSGESSALVPNDDEGGSEADGEEDSSGSGGESSASDGSEDAEGSGEGDEGDPSATRPYREPELDETRLPARTWRLTHRQYQRSVEALIGVRWDTQDFAQEIDNGIYRNFAAVGFVDDALALDYYEAAKEIAELAQVSDLTAFAPGQALLPQSADGFIRELATRAFRRPATDDEVSRYRQVFDLADEVSDDDTAPFRAVLRGVLTSPHFLYRTEFGAPEDEDASVVELTDFEVASLLSYSVLDGPPPAALLETASQEGLRDPEALREAVDDLLADPDARANAREFLIQWLELAHFDDVEKFEDTFPGFAEVRGDMADELGTFLEEHGSLTGGSVAALLGEPVTSASANLEAFYESDTPGDAPVQRIGILSLGAVMAQHAKPNLSSPTLRGLFVRERLLCQHVELPPGFNPPPLSETEEREDPKTTRELYELHAADPLCRSCHALLDPIGFNLEGFDGAGRLRTIENGVDVDTRGELVGTDVDGPIANAAELSQALARSEWVAECMAIQAFRFYLGEVEPSRGIEPIIEARSAAGAEGDLGAMIAAMMSSSSVYERSRE